VFAIWCQYCSHTGVLALTIESASVLTSVRWVSLRSQPGNTGVTEHMYMYSNPPAVWLGCCAWRSSSIVPFIHTYTVHVWDVNGCLLQLHLLEYVYSCFVVYWLKANGTCTMYIMDPIRPATPLLYKVLHMKVIMQASVAHVQQSPCLIALIASWTCTAIPLPYKVLHMVINCKLDMYLNPPAL
jgi:hypothetical protein